MADESVYPGSVDPDMRALVLAAPVTPVGLSDFLAQLADAVRKIETELGITPSGAEATVSERLDALAEGGGTASFVNTDGDPGTTLYCGQTDPEDMDPAPTLETGDVWLDTTPA